MEGRRRLLLLALIIVAVAIGAVGITLVSLFDADLHQRRHAIEAALAIDADDFTGGAMGALDAHGTAWRVTAGELPPALLASLPPAGALRAGEVRWVDDPRAEFLAAVMARDAGAARIAWVRLADMRAPFQRAALHATAALVLLLVAGLFLFYRMTAPLLRSIEKSEARYRTLFANTAEGVVLIGDGIEECNDRFCEMFACVRADVVGLPWRDFFRRFAGGEAGLSRFEIHVQEALVGDGGTFTWAFSPTEDRRLVAEVALRALRDGDRRLVLVSLRDVTTREEAGRVLREAERALRESRETLAQAGRSSALVELAAGFAHEVNQPLAAIANYAQAGRRLVGGGKACSEDVTLVLDRIAQQAQRAGEAIHRIRALVPATPSGGADHTCINILVSEVVALMEEEIEATGTSVRLSLGSDLRPVLADSLQIKQVVVQLLRNALEAVAGVEPARRQVSISTCRVGQEVEVVVADNGPGVGADDRSHLFEPFFSTKENGMGMGLAISMSIIRSHQGELVADDPSGQGACFRFRLPVDIRAPRSDATCPDRVGP